MLLIFRQGCSSQKTPQTVCRDAQFPENVQPVVSASPKTPNHPNTSSDPDLLSSGGVVLNQRDEPGSAALPPPQGSGEETDEQIERLLEDILMGLNILPNMENNCKKSQLSHDGAPTFCHVPGAEGGVEQNHVHAGVGAAGCVFYQDLGTQSTHSPAETGTGGRWKDQLFLDVGSSVFMLSSACQQVD